VIADASVPVDVAVELRAEVGEGPHWDTASQSLWFVDLTGGVVHRFDRASGEVRSFAAGQEVGAVVPRQGGGLVLAARDGIATVTHTGEGFELTVPVELEKTSNRMNDAKCDPVGRLFAGTTAYDFTPGAGALYRIDAGWSCQLVIGAVTTSNGTAWSPDGSRMYYIDSATQGVDVLDYDVASGAAANRRRLVDIPVETGIPDGMTVDAEGNLWVACFGGATVRCYSPLGVEVRSIRLPVTQVTSCAFGGPDYADLYITTAAYRLSAEQLEREPLAGATFVCRPGVSGLPASAFAG
jgi:sugar lactone lactonase YvrE